MTAARKALFAVVSLASALACQLAVGLREPLGREGWGDGGFPDPCAHAVPPPAPARHASDAGARETALWLVMSTIEFPLVDRGEPPRGFDLDEACTCSADLRDGAPPCESPSGRHSCDSLGGVDNTFEHAFDAHPELRDLAARNNEAIAQGGRALLIYLSGYNGEADDDEVGVALVPSDGLFSNLGCEDQPRSDVVEANDGGYAVPLRPFNDGCDRWRPQEGFARAVGSSVQPVAGVGTGYVTKGRLVSGGRPISFALLDQLVHCPDGILTARLEPVTLGSRSTFRARDGVVVGRAPVPDLATAIARTSMRGSSGEQALCASSSWPSLKRALCDSVDTMTTPHSDFQSMTCNAFSLTWAFSADPVQIDVSVRTLRPPAAPPPCADTIDVKQLCE